MMGTLAGCSSGDSCEELVWVKCTRCHSIETTCSQTGKKYAYWERTIGQMIRLNAPISLEEHKKIAHCLVNTKKINNLCDKTNKKVTYKK